MLVFISPAQEAADLALAFLREDDLCPQVGPGLFPCVAVKRAVDFLEAKFGPAFRRKVNEDEIVDYVQAIREKRGLR